MFSLQSNSFKLVGKIRLVSRLSQQTIFFNLEQLLILSEISLLFQQPNSDFNLEKLRKDYQKSQGWLDKNYPKEERWLASKIYVNEPSLEGHLDLSDFNFAYKDSVKILVSSTVDKTKLIFKNLPEKAKIIECVEAQKWIDKYYPVNGVCQRATDDEGWEGDKEV